MATKAHAAAALLIVLAGSAAVADDPQATVRAEFRSAYDAAETAAARPNDSAALRAYALYPYLERARIAADLRGPDERAAQADELARAFLARHASPPCSSERGPWPLACGPVLRFSSFRGGPRANEHKSIIPASSK